MNTGLVTSKTGAKETLSMNALNALAKPIEKLKQTIMHKCPQSQKTCFNQLDQNSSANYVAERHRGEFMMKRLLDRSKNR